MTILCFDCICDLSQDIDLCIHVTKEYLPANIYMTPVTIQAVICFCKMPNVPVRKAVNRHNRQTIVQDAAEFIIPVNTHKLF